MRNYFTNNFLGKAKMSVLTLLLGMFTINIAQAEITRFTTQANGCYAVLTWMTDGNPTASIYEIQKSNNGFTFTTVQRARIEEDNHYTVNLRQDERQVYYRIVEKSSNALDDMSDAMIVTTNCNVSGIGATDIGVYPNPLMTSIGSDLHITVDNQDASTMQITMIDLTGRVLLNQNADLTQGENKIDLNVGSLPFGTYLLMTQMDDAAPRTERIIIQK